MHRSVPEAKGSKVKVKIGTKLMIVFIIRGWVFTPSVDDAESECGLDNVTDWDVVVENDGDETLEKVLEPILNLTKS